MTSPRLRVAVVFGGRSSEHAISCVSAGCVMDALDPERFDVVPIGITTEGRWVLETVDPKRLSISDGRLPAVDEHGVDVVIAPDPTEVDRPDLGAIDVVFPVLHGPWGEDGTIQGLLELAGIPYVGAGVLASAAAMDKPTMKAILRGSGLAVGPYELITDAQWRNDREGALGRARALGSTVFVKPARGGSSQGIRKVDADDDLAAAIDFARAFDPRVIVEAGVADVREIECGVIVDPDGKARASRCAEIVITGPHEFYDFEAKYLDGTTTAYVPAQLPAGVEEQIQQMAVAAFDALGCEGLARVDFFLQSDGTIVVNELNTMPGFTPTSMFPVMWAATGLDYAALLEHLIQDALRRGTGLR